MDIALRAPTFLFIGTRILKLAVFFRPHITDLKPRRTEATNARFQAALRDPLQNIIDENMAIVPSAEKKEKQC